MPGERVEVLIRDAIGAIDEARSFVGDRDEAGYGADPLVRAAVERKLEIVGEALAQLARESSDLAHRVPDARRAVNVRNRLIHGYASVDYKVVYLTVRDDLPALRADLQRWLDELSG